MVKFLSWKSINGCHFHVPMPVCYVTLLDVYQRNPLCETGAVDEKEIYWTQDLKTSISFFIVYTLTSDLSRRLLPSSYSPTPHIIRTVVPAPEGSGVPCGRTQTLLYRASNSTAASSNHLCRCMSSFCLHRLQNEPSSIHHQVPANPRHTRVAHFSSNLSSVEIVLEYVYCDERACKEKKRIRDVMRFQVKKGSLKVKVSEV